MIKKLLICAAVAACLGNMASAQQTKLLTAEKHNEYGLVYSLPLTAFQIEVVVVKEIKIAGPYSKYAKVFTSNSSVISKNETNWSIESVRLTPYGVADPDNRYLMQLKPGVTTYIAVAEDGMLLAINKEVESPVTQPMSINAVEGTPATGKEYLEYVNEDFITAQSSYKQAQLLAEELMEIREAKVSLTRGTAETMPTDGRQLELMLQSLEKQEKALTSAFTGSSWKEKEVRTFSFMPEKEAKYILCKVNPNEGIVDAGSKTGEPLFVSVKMIEEPELPVDAKGDEKKLPKDAVMYNIPGVANISLSFKDQTLYQKQYPISQFGITFGLNPTMFSDKKEPSYAVFDPVTGALLDLGAVK